MIRLADRLARPPLAGRAVLLHDPDGTIGTDDLIPPAAGPPLAAGPPPAAGPPLAADTVAALCIDRPRAFVAALAALDGRVAGLLLLAPGLPRATIETLMARVGAGVVISDRADLAGLAVAAVPGGTDMATRWLMTTSGTTGTPKIVEHSLASLARSVRPPAGSAAPPRWGLLYDPSRFAGLQVVLQALLGGGVLLAPDRHAPLADQLRFLAAAGCTHLSATPTLWRKLSMLPEADALPLAQATLGGEIADAAVLRVLGSRYPAARVTQIYASTEAGVGFSVHDGQPGFPAAYLDSEQGGEPGGVALRVVDGCLWLRPPGPARPLPAHVEIDGEGFIRTGDLVERRGDRLAFLGRDSGAVNIGGTKVVPEDVEAIVNDHPQVLASRVSARPNPIMGSVLALEVAPRDAAADPALLRASVKAWCRDRLPREAQPATVKVVAAIEAAASGKLSRVAA